MSAELFLYALLLPLIFWATYHYYHDRHRPEPVVNLLATLGLGVLASLIAGMGYAGLGLVGLRFDAYLLAETSPLGLLVYAVLGIGLVEELAKMLPFLLVVLRFRDFDDPFDGIVYASFLALGFAMAENYRYADHLSLSEAVARGFAGPVVHMVFASLWGHHIGTAVLTGAPVLPVAFRWLAITALVHGAYDVIVIAFSASALFLASALIVVIWFWRLRLVWRLGGGHRSSR
ncbi:MAG TPA: PrsW family glutamic-type intramembrane protease [Pseudomonadales bacterium]